MKFLVKSEPKQTHILTCSLVIYFNRQTFFKWFLSTWLLLERHQLYGDYCLKCSSLAQHIPAKLQKALTWICWQFSSSSAKLMLSNSPVQSANYPAWPLLTRMQSFDPTLSISCCRTCLATSRSCRRTLSSSFSCSRRLLFFSTLSSWLWRRMDTSFATCEGEDGGVEVGEFSSMRQSLQGYLNMIHEICLFASEFFLTRSGIWAHRHILGPCRLFSLSDIMTTLCCLAKMLKWPIRRLLQDLIVFIGSFQFNDNIHITWIVCCSSY